MTTRAALLLFSCLLMACPEGEPEIVDLTVTLAPPEWGYQINTEPMRVEPYSETFVCSVVRIEPSEDELLVWVDALESLASESSHHMNVFLGRFSFLDAFLEEGAFENTLGVGLGTYDCADLGNLMESAFPIFPSQRTSQRITMPDGVGVPLVAPLVLVVQQHYLNLRKQPAIINAALNIERMDPSDVRDVGSLIFDDIPDLAVPAGGQAVAARTCIMNRDVEVALVSTHNHGRGECATINRYSAPSHSVAVDPFFVNKNWETPPILHFERETFSIAAGDGVHWACHYRDRVGADAVNDGTAEGEMCVFAAVAYPAARSVEDITETLAGGDLLEVYDLLDDVMASCDDYVEADSPWPMTEAPNFDEPVDTCADWDQTESNVLD